MSEMKEYTWEEVEALYITGDYSLGELADKTDKKLGTLTNHSSHDKWGRKREEYRAALVEEKKRVALQAAVNDKEQFDKLTDRSCDVIAAMIATELTEVHQTKQKLEVSKLESMARTVERVQAVKYRRLDVPAPKQPIELEEKNPFLEFQHRLAFARLQIERGENVDGDGNGESKPGELVTMKLEPPVFDN